MIILLSESCQWIVGTWPKEVIVCASRWLTELSSEWALNKAKLLIPAPWAKGSLPGHPHMENHTHKHNSPNRLFLCSWWKVCFISHTRSRGVWLLKCFAALIDFDVLSQNRWKQMARERANGETCQSRESSKKTKWRPGSGRGGNPWAPQEAAAFLRLGQEKRRPLPLMPQTKARNNLLVKNSSSELNQRPVVHNGRLGALVCFFKVNNQA